MPDPLGSQLDQKRMISPMQSFLKAVVYSRASEEDDREHTAVQSVNILDISQNDGWQVASNKINENFRALYKALHANGDSALQSTRVKLEDDLKEAEQRIDRKMTDAIEEINRTVEEAEKAFDAKLKDLDDKLEDFNEVLSGADATNLANLTALINAKVAELNNTINAKTQPKLFAPPVGTYIYSINNPATIYKGTTWAQQGQGNFLIAAGSTYKTGSSYGSNTHTLTESQIPAHAHLGGDYLVWNSNGNLTANNAGPGKGDFGSGAFGARQWTNNTGGGQPHNNIPQSIAVPLWKRTA